MSTEYTYSVAVDFPNQKVNSDSLAAEIATAGLTLDEALGIQVHGDDCCIWLDAGTEAALDDVVAAHQGTPLLQVKYHATASLVEEKAIVDSQDWDYLASAVTHPQFFVADLTKFLGKVVGACLTDGAGAELRVLEDNADGLLGSYTLPDTGGEWAQFEFFSSSLPTPGSHEYIIEGRLGGASAAEIRGTSMTILENVTPIEEQE